MKSPTFFLGQLKVIRDRVAEDVRRKENVHFETCNLLNNIRTALCASFPGEVRDAVQGFTVGVEESTGQPPYPSKPGPALLLCDQLITILNDATPGGASSNTATPINGVVFIVHGHDEANMWRLRTLMKERFGLKPVILMEEASSGQTVVEKFEVAARSASYAVVLMTPDDQIISRSGEVGQARPNVIFELGWFYGRLGRSKVCILAKRGVSIHSDLAGIVRLDFIESVEEALLQLERELRGAGVVS